MGRSDRQFGLSNAAPVVHDTGDWPDARREHFDFIIAETAAGRLGPAATAAAVQIKPEHPYYGDWVEHTDTQSI